MSAQLTYHVFPAVTSESTRAPTQTKKGSAGPLVTLAVKDSTVEYVVNEIARQAHLRPIYNGIMPSFAHRIVVHITNATAMDAFVTVLKGTGLIAKVAPDGETVVIRSAGESVTDAQGRDGGEVRGTVRDSATGHAIAGAKVTLQDMKMSVSTSDRGQFVLSDVAAGSHVLVIRAFGYRAVTLSVTVTEHETRTVQVTLASVPTMLSGVVTTATGQEQRLKVGSDVTVINVDSVQSIAPVNTVTDLLATRVPGLVVLPSSGIPGAPSRLRLRGVSSPSTNNDPIVIVDGIRVNSNQSGSVVSGGLASTALNNADASSGGSSVAGVIIPGSILESPGFVGPSALDQVDPNSIETIEVIKGPSASALYGSDAANGVIIITTKHGNAGPTRWTVGLSTGRTTQPGDWPLNYYRFGQSYALLGGTVICSSANTFVCATDSVVAYQALNDSRFSPIGTGTDRLASLSVSGGTGGLSYAVTGSATDQLGILRLPSIEAARFATTHGFAAPAWMKRPDTYGTWGGSSKLILQLGRTGGTISLSNSLYNSTQQQSSLSAGSALSTLSQNYYSLASLGTNPLIESYYTRGQLASLKSTNALNLQWPVRPWLPLNVTAGMDISTTDNNTVTPRDYILGTDDSLGSYGLSRSTAIMQSLNASTSLRLPHVTTAFGLNVYAASQQQFNASTVGLAVGVMAPSQFVYANNAGPTQSAARSTTYGWYMQPQLDVKSRFFVNPGFRLDGGSATGTQAGLSLFPKIDVSWVALDRQNNPTIGQLTLLRPRIAYGIAGVQPGPVERLRIIQPASATIPGTTTPVDAAQITSVGNTLLHPERSRELEGGIDAEFGNQRVTVALSGYNKTRFDAIMSLGLAPSVGAGGRISENIGTIRNTGFETTVGVRLIDSRFLGWDINTNIAQNRNRVVSLNSANLISKQDGIAPGYPLFAVFSQPILGYADANGNGVIDFGEVRVADSVMYVGQPYPNFEMNFSTTFRVGRLSINTALAYQDGFLQTSGFVKNTGLVNDPATTAAVQAVIAAFANGSGNSLQTNIGQYQTANVLRWNTLAVNYAFPQSTARLFRVSSMSLALQGSNLALHTNYRGKDPGVSGAATGNSLYDAGQLPAPRTWRLRLQLGN